jgi:hypothetical protein
MSGKAEVIEDGVDLHRGESAANAVGKAECPALALEVLIRADDYVGAMRVIEPLAARGA